MICDPFGIQTKALENLLKEMILKINRLEDSIAELKEWEASSGKRNTNGLRSNPSNVKSVASWFKFVVKQFITNQPGGSPAGFVKLQSAASVVKW